MGTDPQTGDRANRWGVLCALIFCVLSASQQVYLGSMFQSREPIAVLVLTFGISALFFLFLQVHKWRRFVTLSYIHRVDFLKLNASTAVSWLSFYVSLKYIEPALGSAVTFGITPLILVLFSRFLRPEKPVVSRERIAAWGIFVGLLVLAVVSYSGQSSFRGASTYEAILGLGLSVVCGVGVVGVRITSKRLHDQGVDAMTIMALRFFLLVIAGLILYPKALQWDAMGFDAVYVAFPPAFCLSFLTVILPLYVLQLAIQTCEPITVGLVVALIPCFTYAIQFLDPRLTPSAFTLLGLLVCVGFVSFGVKARVT